MQTRPRATPGTPPSSTPRPPQIVVVVYIQNGYAGAQASPAAVKVIEYYLDSLGYSEDTTVGIEYSVAD